MSMRPSHAFFVAHHSELGRSVIQDDVDTVVADREVIGVGELPVDDADTIGTSGEVMVEGEGVPGKAAAGTELGRHPLEDGAAGPAQVGTWSGARNGQMTSAADSSSCRSARRRSGGAVRRRLGWHGVGRRRAWPGGIHADHGVALPTLT
jgi:hypothetical protein